MAYSDYGAFVYCNGERRTDKEDVAVFASDEETFGRDSSEIGSGMRIWASLLKAKQDGKELNWLEYIHHGIMGDGAIRVVCHKQGLPQIYELSEQIKFDNDFPEGLDYYEYAPIDFSYKGYEFHFESGHPYLATMKEPDGTFWRCEYDYEYGAGFEGA